MIEFLLASENLAFSVALTVMFVLALLEGVGLLLGAGLSDLIDSLFPSINLDIDAPDIETPGAITQLMGWLYIGKAPILVIIISLLTFFGVLGLGLQSVIHSISGHLLPMWLSAPIALMGALPLSRGSAKLIVKLIPQEETQAVSSSSFIGRVATITLGTARANYPAQARLSDEYGQSHYVMVEPEANGRELTSGSQVLLIKELKHNHFLVIENTNPHLTDNL